MNELALHILDIIQNSFKANSSLVKLMIIEVENLIEILIEDDGLGMEEEVLEQVINPFYTSRNTRKVGLGIPLFKEVCELTGGKFEIMSDKNKGTLIRASVDKGSIDSIPLGNICETIYVLSINNDGCDLLFTHKKNDKEYVFDTREIKKILDGVPFTEYSVMMWIKQYLIENENNLN